MHPAPAGACSQVRRQPLPPGADAAVAGGDVVVPDALACRVQHSLDAGDHINKALQDCVFQISVCGCAGT